MKQRLVVTTPEADDDAHRIRPLYERGVLLAGILETTTTQIALRVA